MSLVAEFSVSTDDFALADALDSAPETSVEVERLATHSRDWVMPFVWASGGDCDAFEDALEADPTVDDARTIDRIDGSRLYRMRWNESVKSQVDSMIDRHAIVQEASADRDRWFLRLRFVDERHLSKFREHFDRNFSLHRKYRPTESDDSEFGLTPEQHETLLVAAELGYFSVPREATVEDIAERLDISSNSVSQRLRRAHRALVQNTLLVNAEQGIEFPRE